MKHITFRILNDGFGLEMFGCGWLPNLAADVVSHSDLSFSETGEPESMFVWLRVSHIRHWLSVCTHKNIHPTALHWRKDPGGSLGI